MDRQQLSTIAHRNHPIACPFSDDKVATLIEQLAPTSSSSVLDIGCGQGEWLRRLLTRCPGATGIGVDQSPSSLAAARARSSSLTARLQFAQDDAATYVDACAGSFDIVLCAGSTHALGGYQQTLTKARPLLGQNGRLLVAEGFWQTPPSEAALGALGAQASDFSSLQETIATAVAAGYAPLYVAVSNMDEWDDYEWNWCGSLERYAAENPEDAHRSEIIRTARSHRDGYLNGYRGVLGFAGLILRPD